ELEACGPSERIGTDHFPAVALERLRPLGVAEGLAALEPLLDESSGAPRRVEEHGAARAGTVALPGMRHVARQEGTGPGSTGEQLVADLEGEVALQHPDDLVTVVMQMVRASGAGRHDLLEQHDALAGLAGSQLEREDAAGRVLVNLPAARGHDEPFGHANLLRVSQRAGAEHFPAGLLQPLLELAVARSFDHFLDELAGPGRGVEEHDAAR